MREIHGFLPQGNNNLVCAHGHFAQYCAALARWQFSKSERDLAAVGESYREFAIAFLGEVDAKPLVTAAEQRWGTA
jgi:hypothetical protein